LVLLNLGSPKPTPLNRIDRLHAISTHLQSKKRVTAQELADRFGLSLRTVYRDIKALEESGVPIIGEAGQGYTIMEGYRLPPVMFTQEEAGALLLVSKLAERLSDKSIKKNMDSALYKIKAVLRGYDKDFMEALNNSVAVSTYATVDTNDSDAAHLVQIQKSLIEKKVLQIDYASPYKQETPKRIVEPIGLFYYSTGWHLIAWCRLRKGYRDFRVDRIKKLMMTDECYTGIEHLSLQDYIRSFQRGELQEVVVLFDKEVARFIVDQKYLRGFLSEEVLEDKVRMTFLTCQPTYLARWLLGYTNAVTIESPVDLQERMVELIEELQAHYTEYFLLAK
jgi:predicted DNA-binding transcriptional regulator YafY